MSKIAVRGPDGKMFGVDQTAEEAERNARAQAAQNTPLRRIKELEATVTPRRLREAILGQDSGWLVALDDEIAALRGQLDHS